MLWSECFLLCMHLVRISVLWFKHVRLSASRINSFSVMQVSQNLAPGKYIPVFALTFHCISGWIFLSFRLQTCFESLVGFLSAVYICKFKASSEKFECRTIWINWKIYKKLKTVEFFNMLLFIFEVETLTMCNCQENYFCMDRPLHGGLTPIFV